MNAIDVIIRTTAEAHRRAQLFRALDTIRDQRGVRTTAIVVVNGERFDPSLVEELKTLDGIVFDYMREGSLIGSRLRGRDLVRAPFFTYLDDDDELIANTLHEPAAWLAAHADCDAVINDVHIKTGGRLVQDDHARVPANEKPLAALMHYGWLHPGGALFRTHTIGRETLGVQRNYMEWTDIAFRLVVGGKRLHFMHLATVIYNDTPDSMSKDARHQENALEVIGEVMAHPAVDRETRRLARAKYANTLHVLATIYWQRGDYRAAWNRHLRSLRAGAFVRYALFTRKLVIPGSFPR